MKQIIILLVLQVSVITTAFCQTNVNDENGASTPIKVKDNNIGIGTSSPSAKLHVNGDVRANRITLLKWYNPSYGHTNNAVIMNGSRDGGMWNLFGDGARSSIGVINTDIFGNISFISHHDYQFKLGKEMSDSEFITESNTKMLININGNVGIGTRAPQSKLHIFGNNSASNEALLRLSSSGTSNLRLGVNSSYSWIQSHGSTPLYINEIGNNTILNRSNGNVGIGTITPDYKLDVAGTIRATEIKVEAQTADFVFSDTYNLKDLTEVENYIKTHKHLPDIPSAEEMEASGVDLAEMNKLLLQKVEELTLHTINQEKQLKDKDNAIKELEKRLAKIETLLLMDKINPN